MTGSLGGMQHSKAPLLSCFLYELSRPLRIYSRMALHSTLPSASQTDVTFKPPFLGLNTSFQQPNKPHTQAIKQPKSEDNINVASFTLNLPGWLAAAVRLSHRTGLFYITASQLLLFWSMRTWSCWHNNTLSQERVTRLATPEQCFHPAHNSRNVLLIIFQPWWCRPQVRHF